MRFHKVGPLVKNYTPALLEASKIREASLLYRADPIQLRDFVHQLYIRKTLVASAAIRKAVVFFAECGDTPLPNQARLMKSNSFRRATAQANRVGWTGLRLLS